MGQKPVCFFSPIVQCSVSITADIVPVAPLLHFTAEMLTASRGRRLMRLNLCSSIHLKFLLLHPPLHLASREGTTCSFADPAFVVYSSVASFYVPFIVTLLVYAQICVVLRKRGRRTAPPRRHGLRSQGRAEAGEGHRHRKVEALLARLLLLERFCDFPSLSTASVCNVGLNDIVLLPLQNKCTQPEDVKLCTLILRPATAAPQRKKVVSFTSKCIKRPFMWFFTHSFFSFFLNVPLFYPPSFFTIKHHRLCLSPNTYLRHPPSSISVCPTLVKEAAVHPLEVAPGQFLPQSEQSLAPPTGPQASPHAGQPRISLSISVGPSPVLPSAVAQSALMPRSPTLEDGMRGREGWRERSAGREKWGITKERVRGRLSQQKERKATQMLAIVLGEQTLSVCIHESD